MACLKDFNGNEIFNHELNPTQKAYITGTPICEDDHIVPQVFDENVYLGETAGSLYATTFYGALSGTASVASKVGTSDVGSASEPIYIKAGVPTKCTGILTTSNWSNYITTIAVFG